MTIFKKPSIKDLNFLHNTHSPDFIKPELATLVKEAPDDDGWLNEIKFDGYRLLLSINNHKTKLFSRNQNDWSKKFPQIIEEASKLNIKQALFDGELVAIDSKGISRFQLLQNHMQFNQPTHLRYYIFDLIYYNNHDLRQIPLLNRKILLGQLLKNKLSNSSIQMTDFVIGHGNEAYQQSCKLGLEGIIAKQCNSTYQSERNLNWVKVKCSKQQEFVVGGYTDPEGSRIGLGSLLIGYYKNSDFIYCGKVGTGFNQASLKELISLLKPITQKKCPFTDFSEQTNGLHWTKPKLVVQVAFSEWTQNKRLRHPSFKGIREDKQYKEVLMESPKGT